MIYGAKGILWAPFAAENPEPANALPNYGTHLVLGELNRVGDNPSYNEAKGYGDNTLGRYVNEFRKSTVDIEILDMPNETASAITGAKIDTEADKDLHFNAEDNAPYGGLAFYVNQLLNHFYSCTALKSVYFPKLTNGGGGNSFRNVGITELILPSYDNNTSPSCIDCKSLELIDLANCKNIGASHFSGCPNLKNIILRRVETPTALNNVNAVQNTPFASGGTGGTVYVPQALISQYQTATNWSTLYAAGTCHFVAIEGSEYE